MLRKCTLRFFKNSNPKSSEVGEFDLRSSPKLLSLSLTYWGARSTFSCEEKVRAKLILKQIMKAKVGVKIQLYSFSNLGVTQGG